MNDSTVSGKATLVLEDGNVFYGSAFGKTGTVTGEICFNTGMAGYLDVLTDPAYYGQIVIMNNAHSGNFNMIQNQIQAGKASVSGIIGRNPEEDFSDLASPETMQGYFSSQEITGIFDIDTRALVIHLRDNGVMNCAISTDDTDVETLKSIVKEAAQVKGSDWASAISTKISYTLGDENASHRVAVLDLGTRKNILECLTKRDSFVKVFNAQTSFAEMEKFNPDGYVATNGPGDPHAMKYAQKTLIEIINHKRTFLGIGLGAQLLALANGIAVNKMKNGHRGLNHPVRNVLTDQSAITAQNVGFGIDGESAKKNKDVTITHVNLNDNGVEGIKLNDSPAIGVQYYPECLSGMRDSKYLFDQFFGTMTKH